MLPPPPRPRCCSSPLVSTPEQGDKTPSVCWGGLQSGAGGAAAASCPPMTGKTYPWHSCARVPAMLSRGVHAVYSGCWLPHTRVVQTP